MAINNLLYDILVKQLEIFETGTLVAGILSEPIAKYLREGGLSTVFSYVYGGMLIWIMLLSIGGVLKKSMGYFKFMMFFLTIFTFAGLAGMGFLITEQGWYGNYDKDITKDTGCQIFDEKDNEWVRVGKKNDDDRYHFQYTSLFGVIILVVYVVPILLRPIDFL